MSKLVKKCLENQFKSVEEGEGWPKALNLIRSQFVHVVLEAKEAKKINNKKLNRYQDVYPYDHSRIVLKKGPCDYINASLVSVKAAEQNYILTQGPLPFTTSHFWLMIWEQDSRAIIMLNRVIEKNMIKCHQYWPLANEDSYVFNDVGLKVSNILEEKESYYTITKLKLENVETEESREVVHFHYTTWPDFGCPQSPTAFLRFLSLVRASGALDRMDQPAVVHCSAGIGRSGTFCLVDSCLRMVKELKMDKVIITDVLVEMRFSRMGLVQTPDQLRFSFLAILEDLKSDTAVNGTIIEDNVVEEEEPPPLPPPRGESLRSRHAASSDERPNESVNPRKKDKQEILEKKVKEIKEKMKNSENWNAMRKNLITPLGIATAAIVGGCVFYAWYSSRAQ